MLAVVDFVANRLDFASPFSSASLSLLGADKGVLPLPVDDD